MILLWLRQDLYQRQKIVKVAKSAKKGFKTTKKATKTVDYTGVTIINGHYANSVYKLDGILGKKYPKGVKFNKYGFPDFSPYSIKTVKVKGMNGDNEHDKKLANKIAGYGKKPTGYTWHHVEDGITMMLLPTELHSSVKHTGGAKGIRHKNKK